MHSPEDGEESRDWDSIPPELAPMFEAWFDEVLQDAKEILGPCDEDDKALPYIPIEITHIIFNNISDMKGLVLMGMTCRSFYNRFRERFDELIHTVDLRRLKYEHLKGFLQNIGFYNAYEVNFYTDRVQKKIIYAAMKNRLRECIVNDVYNGFLNKYMPKRMEGTVDMDFYDFWGWECKDEDKIKKAMVLLDRARELETGKLALRNGMDLVYALRLHLGIDKLIVERIYDFLNYVEKEINSQT